MLLDSYAECFQVRSMESAFTRTKRDQLNTAVGEMTHSHSDQDPDTHEHDQNASDNSLTNVVCKYR